MKRTYHFIQFIVTLAILSGFFSAFYYLTVSTMPDKNENMLTFMLGQISGLAATVVNYWFGSTSSSKHKDDMLANALATPDKKVEDGSANQAAGNN